MPACSIMGLMMLGAGQGADITIEAEGWDVTDDKRRPLRMLDHFAPQLWLALRGVAGELPFQAQVEPDPMKSSLALDAARFRRDRR